MWPPSNTNLPIAQRGEDYFNLESDIQEALALLEFCFKKFDLDGGGYVMVISCSIAVIWQDLMFRTLQVDELLQGLGASGCPKTSEIFDLFENMDQDDSGNIDICEVKREPPFHRNSQFRLTSLHVYSFSPWSSRLQRNMKVVGTGFFRSKRM